MVHLLSLGGSLLKFAAAKEQPQLRIHGGEGDCSGRGHLSSRPRCWTPSTQEREWTGVKRNSFSVLKYNEKNRHEIQKPAGSSSDACGRNKLLNWAAKTFWYQMTVYSSLVFIILYFCVSYKAEL